jgi:hypothetical protein
MKRPETTNSNPKVVGDTPPLAWGRHGNVIAVPEGAGGWRVSWRRLGVRGGSPSVVYEAGRPLILPLDATHEQLVERVGARPGRYRLDLVDARGRPVTGAEPAYSQVDAPIALPGPVPGSAPAPARAPAASPTAAAGEGAPDPAPAADTAEQREARLLACIEHLTTVHAEMMALLSRQVAMLLERLACEPPRAPDDQ